MSKNVRERNVFKAGLEAELQLLIPGLAADPGSPVEREVWLNTTTDELKYYNGAATITVGANLTTEQIQDIVGPFFGDSSDLDATYDDAGNAVSAVVKADSITFAKMQNIATARILGRVTASSGDIEELTAAQVKTLLAIVAADISDFTANARSSISVTDSATLDLSYAGGAISGTVLDSPLLDGDTKATIISDAVAAIVGGAGSAYDTLVEIQGLMEADDTQTTAMLASIAARARFFAADLTGGATTENVDHGLALAVAGDFTARVFVKATGVEEQYFLNPTTVNRIVVTDETGGNIPAGRRIFITAGAS